MDKVRYQKHILEQRKLYEGKSCEVCGKEHDHSYGTGRFCSKHCAYAFKKTKGASPKLKAHLDKLRAEGKVGCSNKPYGTWKCLICSQVFKSRSQLKKHQCEVHGKLEGSKTDNGKFKCQYCGKEFDKKQSLGAHMGACKMHPDKVHHDLCRVNQGKRLSDFYAAHPEKNVWNGRHHSIESRQKISDKRAKLMRTEYLDNPHAYVKWYKVKNIKNEEFSVRGHWEENVALQLNKLGIYWTKSDPIKYFNEYWHNYIPDLYVPSMDVYVEVKGRYSNANRIKMRLVTEQNPGKKIYFINNRKYRAFIHGHCPFNDNLLIKDEDLKLEEK